MLTSETRSAYYHKSIFIFLALTLVVGAALINIQGIRFYYAWPMAFGVSSIIALMFLKLFSDATQRKIIIEDDRIAVYNLLSSSPEVFLMSEVLNVQTVTQKSNMKLAPINDGFKITTVTFTENREILISQEQYVNYLTLVHAVSINLSR